MSSILATLPSKGFPNELASPIAVFSEPAERDDLLEARSSTCKANMIMKIFS
jgi:hypothetical protein